MQDRITRGGWIAFAAGVALAASLGFGCAPAPASPPHIVLFSVDTLRADHLGCYGYPRETSPRIDAFARQGVLFRHAWAPAPGTLASHAEMLTGQHPYRLGVRTSRSSLPSGVPTLAELLAVAGYETAAFVDSAPRGLLGGARGFARGFERYEHAPHRRRLRFEYDAAATMDVALAWLRNERDPERPFFLFLHTKSVHAVKTPPGTPGPPYDHPGPGRFRFVDPDMRSLEWRPPIEGRSYLAGLDLLLRAGRIDSETFPASRLAALTALYDGAIRYVDERFGRLLDGLEESGFDERTIVVLTADHGEEFLDHGRFNHGQLHRPLLRVPLIVRRPRGPQGLVVDADVRLADIAPTLLEEARVARPSALEGRPLFAADDVAVGDGRPLYAHHATTSGGAPVEHFALRKDGWTLVTREAPGGREVELYHHARDPQEQSPVNDQPRRSAAMLEEIDRWREGADPGPVDDMELDAETRAHLRALGYEE